MIASLQQSVEGLLLAVPLVAAVCFVLVFVPPVVSFMVAMTGIALLIVSETFHSKLAAALGGVLAMGGVMAWALAATRIV